MVAEGEQSDVNTQPSKGTNIVPPKTEKPSIVRDGLYYNIIVPSGLCAARYKTREEARNNLARFS